MWNFIKNLILVTLVTVVIWVFAESESLSTAEVRSVEISMLPAPGAKQMVELAQNSPAVHGNIVRVDMVLEGPTAALDVVQRMLRNPIAVNPGVEGFPIDPGTHIVDLQTVLRNHPDLKLAANGVSIKSISPETVDATIDELVSRPVKIDVDVPGAELDGPPELKTTAASVMVPQSQAGKVTENTAVIARIDPAALTRLNPGRKETITGVRLVAPPELASIPRLKIDPATVDIALTLRTKAASIKVASVPVHVRIAPGELNKWDIEVPEQDRFLTDVIVSGPSDLVKQVQDKTVPLIATVSLSFEELERAIPSKDAVFCDLTTGLHFDVANKTVRLKIKRRETAAAPAQPPKQPQ
jgi:hypothetical protein